MVVVGFVMIPVDLADPQEEVMAAVLGVVVVEKMELVDHEEAVLEV